MKLYRLSPTVNRVIRNNPDGSFADMPTTASCYLGWILDGNTPDPAYTQGEIEDKVTEKERLAKLREERISAAYDGLSPAEIKKKVSDYVGAASTSVAKIDRLTKICEILAVLAAK